MAYGNETMLVIGEDRARALAERLDVPWCDPNADLEGFWDVTMTGLHAAVEQQLRDAHRAALEARDDVDVLGVIAPGQPFSGYLQVRTSAGAYPCASWSLEFADDAGDGERHELLSRACLGIAVATRYVPVWLDLDQPHGGSGMPVLLDQQLLELVDQARDAIAEVIEEFADAELAVVPRWY